jgi:GWxTD domain-containing protein
MSDERVELEFQMCKFIASSDEVDKFNMLSQLEAKQRFLYTFWKSRDPDLKTPINENRIEFLKAIEHANTFFSVGDAQSGWKSDRGRVLLKYGFPSQRDEFPADNINRAYEIWHYDYLQGGVRFYFVDILGYKNFQLVHSTAIGEMVNPNWFNDYVPYDKLNTIDTQQKKYR